MQSDSVSKATASCIKHVKDTTGWLHQTEVLRLTRGIESAIAPHSPTEALRWRQAIAEIEACTNWEGVVAALPLILAS